MQNKIREFHRGFGYPTPNRPTIEANYELRHRLIKEELEEYYDACDDKDIVEIADAIGDMLYLVMGAAVEHGIDIDPIFNEIHRSNMSKFENGKAIRRNDGKVLKGKNYFKPRLKEIIDNQINEKKIDYELDQDYNFILDCVSEVTRNSKNEIESKSRERHLVYARHYIAYLLRSRDWTYPRISHVMQKNHATIINSVNIVRNMLSYDDDVNKDIERLRDMYLRETNINLKEI